ncbi:unnamed protein product, partial [Prorocentrum cordatum]
MAQPAGGAEEAAALVNELGPAEVAVFVRLLQPSVKGALRDALAIQQGPPARPPPQHGGPEDGEPWGGKGGDRASAHTKGGKQGGKQGGKHGGPSGKGGPGSAGRGGAPQQATPEQLGPLAHPEFLPAAVSETGEQVAFQGGTGTPWQLVGPEEGSFRWDLQDRDAVSQDAKQEVRELLEQYADEHGIFVGRGSPVKLALRRGSFWISLATGRCAADAAPAEPGAPGGEAAPAAAPAPAPADFNGRAALAPRLPDDAALLGGWARPPTLSVSGLQEQGGTGERPCMSLRVIAELCKALQEQTTRIPERATALPPESRAEAKEHEAAVELAKAEAHKRTARTSKHIKIHAKVARDARHAPAVPNASSEGDAPSEAAGGSRRPPPAPAGRHSQASSRGRSDAAPPAPFAASTSLEPAGGTASSAAAAPGDAAPSALPAAGALPHSGGPGGARRGAPAASEQAEAPAASADEDSECGGGRFEEGVAYEPLGMPSRPSPQRAGGAAECRRICLEEALCAYFSFERSGSPADGGGSCHLHDALAVRRPGRAGFTAGPRQTWCELSDEVRKRWVRANASAGGAGGPAEGLAFVPPAYRCMVIGGSYSATLVSKVIDEAGPRTDPTGILRCQQWCADTPGCAFFSLEVRNRSCWLHQSSAKLMFPTFGRVGGPASCDGVPLSRPSCSCAPAARPEAEPTSLSAASAGDHLASGVAGEGSAGPVAAPVLAWLLGAALLYALPCWAARVGLPSRWLVAPRARQVNSRAAPGFHDGDRLPLLRRLASGARPLWCVGPRLPVADEYHGVPQVVGVELQLLPLAWPPQLALACRWRSGG